MLMGALYVLRAKIRKLFRLGNPTAETTDDAATATETEAEPALFGTMTPEELEGWTRGR